MGVWAEGEEAKEVAPVHSLNMDPLVLSYINPKTHNVSRFVVINYSVEVNSAETLKKLKVWLRRIHDNVYINVYNYLAIFWQPKKPINEVQLRMLLKEILGGFVGEENIKKINIQDVITDIPART